MQYFITFLEGVITFISPCVLPMLPVYVMYFAGGTVHGEEKIKSTLVNALGFVTGFTLFFTALGVFAGSLGGLLAAHGTTVNILTGTIVVLFGLHYAGILRIGLFDKTIKPGISIKPSGYFSSVLFGAVFAVGWSPCTGAYLGSAMMMAAAHDGWLTGMLLLLAYSLGLGIPFLICAVLIGRLKTAFDFIKRHYQTVNTVCGIFLIITGVLMMTGLFSRVTAALA